MLKFLEETSPRDRQPGKLDSELDQFFAMDMDSPSDVESIATNSPLKRKKRRKNIKKDRGKDRKMKRNRRRTTPKPKRQTRCPASTLY